MNTLKSTNEQVQVFIAENPFWSLKTEKLYREFIFDDFVTAFGFMAQAALIAERSNHHPEWSNVYKKVVVYLTTHEANGISEKDFKLAQAMDNIASHIN